MITQLKKEGYRMDAIFTVTMIIFGVCLIIDINIKTVGFLYFFVKYIVGKESDDNNSSKE